MAPADPALNTMLADAGHLAGPMPGDPPGVLAEAVGSAAASVAAATSAELSVAFVRSPSTPPTLLDAVAGCRLLSARPPATAVTPVSVVADAETREPALVLTEEQRRSLDRLAGRGGARVPVAKHLYRGTTEVARLLSWVAEISALAGHRWPRAAATLTGEPLRVLVPQHLVRNSDRLRVALVDSGPTLLPRAVAAVVALDYRDLLTSAIPAEFIHAARRWHDLVGPKRFIVAVDGIEYRQAVPDDNLRITVWTRTAQLLDLPLDWASVVAVSSSWALAAQLSRRPSAQDLVDMSGTVERSGIYVLVGRLAPLWESSAEVLAAAIARRIKPIPEPPPANWGFTSEDETAAWSRLHHTACGPLTARVGRLWDEIGRNS